MTQRIFISTIGIILFGCLYLVNSDDKSSVPEYAQSVIVEDTSRTISSKEAQQLQEAKKLEEKMEAERELNEERSAAKLSVIETKPEKK